MEYFIAIFALFVLVIIPLTMRQRRIAAVRHVLNRKKQNKENLDMKELAKQFIGKDCIVYTVTSNDASNQHTYEIGLLHIRLKLFKNNNRLSRNLTDKIMIRFKCFLVF